MAWFGGKLSQFSNLTDQISTFTKEVLTETTEEVEDPSAELQIAKKRVSELEAINEYAKTEYDKLKAHCEEITERLETSECQISAISQEYRKLLQEKEEELKRCRKDNERLREEHKHLVHGSTAQSPLKELAGAGGQFFQNGGGFESVDLGGNEGEWAGDFHDFGDIVTSQGVINQLQTELAKLKVECQHWKDAASLQTADTDDTQKLKDEITDLQATLKREREQKQQELSSLQTVHSEHMSTLTARHQQEIEQLQRRVVDSDGVRKTESDKLVEEVSRLREVVRDHERLEKEVVTAKELNSLLENDLRALTAEKVQLEGRLAESVSALEKEKDHQVSKLDEEKTQLQVQLGDLQSSITRHQGVISKLQEEHSQSLSELQQLRKDIETLEVQVSQKEAEIHSLKQKHEHTIETGQTQVMHDHHSLEELAALREEVRALKEDADRTKASHEMEQRSNMEKLQTLESEKNQLLKQLSDKAHTVQELTTHLEAFKSQLMQRDSSELDHKSAAEELRGRNEVLSRDLEVKQEECVKYSKQLSQLRVHLLEVEERYTQEALKADEREAVLKQELTHISEKLANATSQDNQQNRILEEQLARAQDELQAMMEQRDDALLQMSNAQEQAHQNATSLRNLQTVLEQFQRDQSSELAQALKRSQRELADARGRCSELEARLGEADRTKEMLVSLREELAVRDAQMEQLHKELEAVTQALEKEKKEKLKLLSDNVERVDRALVKNLVLGYLHATDTKKPEVLQLMSKILGFSDEELAQAMGKGRGKGWLWGLWSGPPTQSQESLSRLFVEYLETESIPRSSAPSTPVPGYVDSRTDPDRPSLAMAALMGPRPPLATTGTHPPPSIAPEPPTHGTEAHPTPPSQSEHTPSRPHTTATPTTDNTKQSSILSNVLNS